MTDGSVHERPARTGKGSLHFLESDEKGHKPHTENKACKDYERQDGFDFLYGSCRLPLMILPFFILPP